MKNTHTCKNIIPPFAFTVESPFKSGNTLFNRFKASMIAFGVRIALSLGYVVILVGFARSGKSYILERATPGKIIDKKREVLSSGRFSRQELKLDEVPNGSFSVDEIQLFDANSLLSTLRALSNRTYLIAVQSSDVSQEMGLDQLFATRRRIEITFSK